MIWGEFHKEQTYCGVVVAQCVNLYGYGLEDLGFVVLLHFCVLFRAAVIPVPPVGLSLGGRGVELTKYCCVNCCFTLDAGLLAISQYSECPATGNLDTVFSWFPYVYNKWLDGCQGSKLPLNASHVALQIFKY